MIIKEFIKQILGKGFRYLGCNQPDIAIFLRPTSTDSMDICILADNTGNSIYSSNRLKAIYNEVERKFIFSGYRNFNSFYIILTNDINRDKAIGNSEISFWLVDTLLNRIIVYDNQPYDIFNFRSSFENIFNQIPAKKRAFSFKTSFPFITILLIAINILIFLIQEFSGDTNNSYYMLEHGASNWRYIFENGEYYRLVTSMFMHFGSEHLLNNMITLAFIGIEVEHRIGHIRFSTIYLLSGIGAGFISAIYNMNTDANVVSAGASGAIFGILGSLLVITLLMKESRRNIKPINIFIIIILSIANGYSSFAIDNMAHIGGLMFGIILTFISCLCTKNILK